MEIKVPFLKEEVGAGDVVKAATGAVGVQPCTPCEERRRRLNAALRFVPAQQAPVPASAPSQKWTKPPEVPDGWRLVRSFSSADGTKDVQLFRHSALGYIVWSIIGGEYRDSHSFCCESMAEQAVQVWSERCQIRSS